ncbi:hypothetical protein PUMCH_002240 [Australozyma saopauloensis]|uniref:rRNA biogenesis protein RRP36 n=1 Tax=Australozyma saopauloensis TaxID=291208 RepID=A0AAX4H8P1_9ASCO|nr:hypothetical protein PUMCH_002240 [[Candida] saopauloensis]
MSRIRPRYDSESENELEDILSRNKHNDNDDDDFSSLSFAALSSAQEKLRTQDRLKSTSGQKAHKGQTSHRQTSGHESDLNSEFDSDSDSDAEPESYSSKKGGNSKLAKKPTSKNKHAPSESSSKKPVSTVREIPGLATSKGTSLYKDIRFDAAYGKADWNRIRKDYAFLDEYRETEISEMNKTLRDKKAMLKMSDYQAEKMKFKVQSLKSRLDTLKNRDLADKIVADHKKEQIKLTKTGQQTNPYFLKKSEQRKMIQKAKFDTMKNSQREKVMERKRKRRLGKEFKQLEFRGQDH